MTRAFWGILIFLLVAVTLSFFFIFNKKTEKSEDNITVSEALSDYDTSGYAKAIEPIKFKFPEDFGKHENFKTEWWYFTGNLITVDKREFGFQLTIFRHGLSSKKVERKSKWAANQLYMGHFAITDVNENKFYFYERYARDSKDLAGVNQKPLKIWLEDWSINFDSVVDYYFPIIRLFAEESGNSINLELKSTKPIVLHGNNGLSQKSGEPGNASYYYSLTALKAAGTIKIGNEKFEVKGSAWLDKEWSTSALSRSQTGWDWFSIQLTDSTELMFYRLRETDGSSSDASSGTYINKIGSSLNLKKDDVKLSETGSWKSPSGSQYPSGWIIEIPKLNIKLEVKPKIKNQEMKLNIRYWEGAVTVNGFSSGKSLTGNGYVELTGY